MNISKIVKLLYCLIAVIFLGTIFLGKPGQVLAVAPQCNGDDINHNSQGHYSTTNPNCDVPGDCIAETVSGSKGLPGHYVCWPKGGTTTPLSCPNGSYPIPPYLVNLCPELKDQCCPDAFALAGTCNIRLLQDGHPATCADQDAALHPFPKSCTDPTTVPQNGACVKVAQSKWDFQNQCDDHKTVGIQSAIGCIPTGSLPTFLAFVLKFALGAAGGIVLLMFIATGYTLITSTGNPEKLQAVKENLVSIFSGLILIGFSLVLLQTIGVSVLKLPGF